MESAAGLSRGTDAFLLWDRTGMDKTADLPTENLTLENTSLCYINLENLVFFRNTVNFTKVIGNRN